MRVVNKMKVGKREGRTIILLQQNGQLVQQTLSTRLVIRRRVMSVVPVAGFSIGGGS